LTVITSDDGAGAAFDRFRVSALLSRDDLWISYMGVGGAIGFDDFVHYLADGGQLSRLEHNVLAQTLNERFGDLGLNHPVPYRD
jgi:hypothetical protein